VSKNAAWPSTGWFFFCNRLKFYKTVPIGKSKSDETTVRREAITVSGPAEALKVFAEAIGTIPARIAGNLT
jgi:hypothetical protein